MSYNSLCYESKIADYTKNRKSVLTNNEEYVSVNTAGDQNNRIKYVYAPDDYESINRSEDENYLKTKEEDLTNNLNKKGKELMVDFTTGNSLKDYIYTTHSRDYVTGAYNNMQSNFINYDSVGNDFTTEKYDPKY